MSQPVPASRADRRVGDWLKQPPAWLTALTLSVAIWGAAIYLTETPVSPIVVAGGAPFVALTVALLSALDRIDNRVLGALLGVPCVAALTLAALALAPVTPHIYP